MRFKSKNSQVKLTERQAQMLVAAESCRLDTHSGPAYFEIPKSAFMRVAFRLSELGLLWFDIINSHPDEVYMLYCSDEGEEWLGGCEERPLLPPLMAYVANMPG